METPLIHLTTTREGEGPRSPLCGHPIGEGRLVHVELIDRVKRDGVCEECLEKMEGGKL